MPGDCSVASFRILFKKKISNSSFSFFFSVSGADGASANGNLFLIISIFSYLVG
jgi:hypothetical protein